MLFLESNSNGNKGSQGTFRLQEGSRFVLICAYGSYYVLSVLYEASLNKGHCSNQETEWELHGGHGFLNSLLKILYGNQESTIGTEYGILNLFKTDTRIMYHLIYLTHVEYTV